MKTRNLSLTMLALFLTLIFNQCAPKELLNEVEDVTTKSSPAPATTTGDQYILEQAISDEAQGNTIAFDGLGFMTGSLGSQTFLPPGKVADYSGFQYLRDNDPTQLGHNTSFVTIIAFNMLNILTSDQIQLFVTRAKEQISQINEFGYKRFPLCKAFRRLINNELPGGTSGLSLDAVMAYTADLYRVDGLISTTGLNCSGKLLIP